MLADAYLIQAGHHSALVRDHAAADDYVSRHHLAEAEVHALLRADRLPQLLEVVMRRAQVPPEHVEATLRAWRV